MKRRLGWGILVLIVLLWDITIAGATTVSLDIAPRAYDRDDYCAEVCIQEALLFLGFDVSQDFINEAGG